MIPIDEEKNQRCSLYKEFAIQVIRILILFAAVIYGLAETKYTTYGIFLTVLLTMLMFLQLTRLHRIFFPIQARPLLEPQLDVQESFTQMR
jgi:hypothetical protein